MKIIIFVSAETEKLIGLERMINAVKFRLGQSADIYLSFEKTTSKQSLQTLSWEKALLYPAEAWVVPLAKIPILESPRDWANLSLPGKKENRDKKQIYIMEPHGLIHLLEEDKNKILEARLGSKDESYLDEHIFSRLAPRVFRGTAYPFPYNGFYEALSSSFSPIQSFGFRFSENLQELEKRNKNILLVTIFGGSCVFSPACLQNETFSSQISLILNRYIQQENKKYSSAVVLNFGNSGATVLNEMITYLLFAQKLKPEIVIAHDIFNDFAHGLRTDPVLLAKYKITYLPELENWAQMLLNSPEVPLSQNTSASHPFVIKSSPKRIIEAFLERKNQFLQIVEKSESIFLYGIQPAWFSKPHAPRETEKMNEIRKADLVNAPIYERMETLYKMAIENIKISPPKHFINVHEEFSMCGSEEEMFVDHAHLNAKGDKKVAQIYSNYIINKLNIF